MEVRGSQSRSASGHPESIRSSSVRGHAFPGGLLGLVVAVYILGAAAVVVATTALFPLRSALALPFAPFGLESAVGGLVVWILVGLATSSRSSIEEGRLAVVYGVGPVVAAAALGGPAAAVWVALVGSTERRELTGEVPWYGVFANHGMLVIPAAVCGVVIEVLRDVPLSSIQEARGFVAVMIGAASFTILNVAMAYVTVRLRTGRSFHDALGLPVRTLASMFAAESALGWVFAAAYQLVAWWSPIVLAIADIAASTSLDRGRAGWLARHHQLTQLPNRLALQERAADFARQRRFPVAVFYLDLNNFKSINDTHDHDTGDRVLEIVGRRLAGAKREDDFLAHLHGDEFVVLAPAVATVEAAQQIATRLAAAIGEPLMLPELTLEVTASVGFQLVEDLADLNLAIRDADRRMQRSKRAGRRAAAAR